jgi:hypothetical protein
MSAEVAHFVFTFDRVSGRLTTSRPVGYESISEAEKAAKVECCCRRFLGGVAQFLLCGAAKSSHELNRIQTTHQIVQLAPALLFLTLAHFLRG